LRILRHMTAEELSGLGFLLRYTAWPFDAQEAARRQRETAAALGQPVEKTLDLGKGVKMELVLIPAGEFMMGSGLSPQEVESRYDGLDGCEDEHPQHRVRITRPFYMGKYEVTNAQYQQFLRESGYDGSQDVLYNYLHLAHYHDRDWREHAPTGADYPVVAVSWKNAQAFCQWLSRKTGREVRLPTEAEWEYACRAGSSMVYHFGDSEDRLGDYAWYHGNSDWKTHPVGQKRPNAWGLYDMHGNVEEWCADWYGEDYYAQSPAADPAGPTSGTLRVLRGGAWYSLERDCRSADRDHDWPTFAFYSYGFRVVVSAQ